MASTQVILVAVMVMVVVAGGRASTLPWGDCTHNIHCNPHSCCRVGFMRYSIPTCSPHGEIGDPCSPVSSEPSSRTLYYPNDISVKLEEAHFGLCPCRSGLECRMGTCHQVSESIWSEPDSTPSLEYNSFDSEYE